MKKIFSLIVIFICFKSFGQFPQSQNFGTATTVTEAKGAFRGIKGLINGVYADTTAANADHIDFYNGAQIWTTSDKNFWVRDAILSIWLRVAKFSEVGGASGETVTYIDGTNYTVLAGDEHIVCTPNFNGTITLPSAAANSGRRIRISANGSGHVISPAFVYNGIGTTNTFQLYYSTENFISDGTDWIRGRVSRATTLASTGTGTSLVHGGDQESEANDLTSLLLKDLKAGSGITLTPTGNDVTIAATGGGSNFANADLTFTADRFHDLDDFELEILNGAFGQFLIDGQNRRYGLGDYAAEGNGRSLQILDTATITDAYKMPAMQQATTSNIMYYNTVTGGVTYGGFNITSEENFQHYLDKLSSVYGAFYWVSSGTASAVQGFTTSAVPLGMLGPHELKTGTTTTGLACHYTQAGGTYAAIALSSSIRYNFRARVQIPVVSDGTETFEYYAGFMDDITGSANIVDGVYFTYTHSVSSGEWVCHTESNNTKTTTASGVTMTAGQNYDLKITVIGGTAYFYIDDVLVVTTATNVPDDDTNRITSIGDCIIKSAGTTSRSVYVDILAYGRRNQ